MNYCVNLWRTLLILLLLVLLPMILSAAPAAPATVQIAGAVTAPAFWQMSDLRRQFKSSLQAIIYTRKGVTHTAQAIPLWTVLQTAQPRINPQIKNHLLQFVVLVVGSDGYTAAFSMAELSPDFGDRKVWLTLEEDGKPLGDEGGQCDIVVPEDKKAGRWVHSVAQIKVVDEALASAAGGH